MIMIHDGHRAAGRPRRRGLRAEAAGRRERRIEELVTRAEAAGAPGDRMYWTLHHDFELAPLTTNAEQLREVGVDLPPDEQLDDRQLQQQLWEVIETLADLGVFLLRTDHLDDRALYRLLEGHVLREPVRDLPPSPGVSEFIDLAARAGPDAVSVTTRDRFLPQPETPPAADAGTS
jgi:hypothetical protein